MSIPAERIERLTDLAHAAAKSGQDDRARRYVRLARRIAERNRLSLPTRLDRFACESCDRFRIPGRTARVRIQPGHVVITCDCGSQDRYPFRP
ncbi:MAG: ribonuclease P protein component 4 [Halodesulfurarchaeum sp.]